MFSSFRRRPKAADINGRDTIKPSPSLPELHAQGIPWPENLVDVAAIRQQTSPSLHQSQEDSSRLPHQGAVKSSLQSSDSGAPIPFHKPFRVYSGNAGDVTPNGGGTISSLYMSHPPSAFDNWRMSSSAHRVASARIAPSLRKNRLPSTFNIMVVGGRGTGKTSLLRLLLETADISPTATDDQRAVVDRFMRDSLKRTHHIDTACVEICESRHDRVLLTVIDTPGLDFSEGRELRVERQVTDIVKYLDVQYADTMNEESKVVRQNKGDRHVHLCIFMVDPSTIMTTSARRSQSSLPTKTRSEATISYRPPDGTFEPDEGSDSDSESSSELSMSPAEIRVIRRLSARVNVLPVIARADSLTDDTLSEVKKAVRKGLHEAGLDFGVFTASKQKGEEGEKGLVNGVGHENGSANANANGNEVANGSGSGNGNGHNGHVASEEEPARKTRPVIKLRGFRLSRSRSRSRRDLSSVVHDDSEPYYPDDTDRESVASVRFSAHVVAKADMNTLLPFALITPEHSSTPRPKRPRPTSVSSSPPEDLRGVFTRKFRWGTIDVLNPEHCDFAALRTAVLLTHLKILKIHTREVLYEKYRTEKLLARRATRNIGPEETKRLFEARQFDSA
ncbi:hypothetical protein SERLADRAFT_416136 [Serpula lacrymans var. lacrymans S7.9]|uniref:Septin-type G domain-containing protein n=1 Tax=Serpula lacrymans var. lacrymans (strain S7.9) TaxID=578457 RepID=F8NYX0_SERL9|nr:uncharacterized protein SERLADRAFT_416136 [Serpula lacrymans var. lacrymans S7.9]EGO23791.1 hypothetical protein SERLADRAFT_416136 [Serpula lacrymans var. lacrymans S7.9]